MREKRGRVTWPREDFRPWRARPEESLGAGGRHTDGTARDTPTGGGRTPQTTPRMGRREENPTDTPTDRGGGDPPQSPRHPPPPPRRRPARTPQAAPHPGTGAHTRLPPCRDTRVHTPAMLCTDRQSPRPGVGQFYFPIDPPQPAATVSLIQARTRCTSTYTLYLETVQVLS